METPGSGVHPGGRLGRVTPLLMGLRTWHMCFAPGWDSIQVLSLPLHTFTPKKRCSFYLTWVQNTFPRDRVLLAVRVMQELEDLAADQKRRNPLVLIGESFNALDFSYLFSLTRFFPLI